MSGATVNANNLLDIAVTGSGLSVSSGALNVGADVVSGQLVPVTISGGALNFNTTSPVFLPSVQMSGGTLGGTGEVTVTGAFNVTGHSFLSGTGLFTTEGVSTVNLGGGATLLSINGGKTWVNEGVLTVAGDDAIYFGYTSGGTNTLTNAAGATLNLSSTHATPLNHWTGTATLNNAGVLNLTVAGAHAISGSIAFHNSGSVKWMRAR